MALTAALHVEDRCCSSCKLIPYCSVMGWQLCPGGTVAVLFSGPIIEGFADNRNLAATLCNAAALPGCVLALLLADRVGRLKLLVVSAAGQAAAAAALAFFFLVKTRGLDVGVAPEQVRRAGPCKHFFWCKTVLALRVRGFSLTPRAGCS